MEVVRGMRRMAGAIALAMLFAVGASAAETPNQPPIWQQIVVWIMARIGGPGT